MSNLQFSIFQLRNKSNQTLLEAVLIALVALFSSAILPSLLLQYVYAGQQLLAPPPLLNWIPTVAYAVSVLYFIFAILSNFLRERKIKALQKELAQFEFAESGPISETELKELEGIVDQALKSSSKPRKTRKSNKKKKTGSSKKTKTK